MTEYAEPAAALAEAARARAKRSSERYQFDWLGIPLSPRGDPGLLVAVPRDTYRSARLRAEALARWDRLAARILQDASDPDMTEMRRARFLALGRSGELANDPLPVLVLVEERTTRYPDVDLIMVVADELRLGPDPLRGGEGAAVQATVLGMFGANRRFSRAAIIAREWRRFEERERDTLFAEIVAPTALRIAAVVVGAISGTGAVAVGARVLAMIAEAVLDMTEFLELLEDPDTTEEEAVVALVGLFPLISTRMELYRAGLLGGYALVSAIGAAARLWASRTEHALGAYEHGAQMLTFEDESTLCVPLDLIIEPNPSVEYQP